MRFERSLKVVLPKARRSNSKDISARKKSVQRKRQKRLLSGSVGMPIEPWIKSWSGVTDVGVASLVRPEL